MGGLSGLKILRLEGNSISSVDNLSAIAGNLSSLWLAFNKITSVAGLSGLSAGCTLNLGGNPVSDWSPVSHVKSVTGRP